MNTPTTATLTTPRRHKPRPPVDPLVRATKRIRGKTTLGQLEALIAQQTKWRSRATFARNKLLEIESQIQRTAYRLAHEKFQHELDSQH